jgi:DNA-binding winged helix-turn-helix (wHTH) protein/serine/threonine protein kinase
VDPNQSTPHVQRVSGHVWRFAGCEFDELRHELRVRGTTVDVEGKPLEVLHQLLLHAGEVVTKDELLESVWPGLIVVDGSLATAVSKLRKVLGDDSIVVTLPRVGYRLAVPVQRNAIAPPAWPELHLRPSDPVPGRDQWRLIRRLDLSPSSEVWLAEHPRTHEARVFKFAPDDVRLKSLKREVTLARLLRESLGERPEFVRILEWNFTSPPYFVESEYVGPNLAEWAEGQGGLDRVPLEVRWRLLADVARAVVEAHKLDVLHKDLKPGNILISSGSDGSPQIRIADFGSAALLAPERLGALGITNLGFTQTGTGDAGSLTGTMLYVAPEVLAGQSPTAASDVYALGVLLYQLTVGDFRRPVAPGWESDIADSLIRDDIAAAACGEPSRRITTAAELSDRLVNLERRRLAAEEAHQRARMDARRQTRTAARRRWIAFGGVAILTAAVVAVIANRASLSPPRPKTVAVLPFQNTGNDPTIEFLRLALADEIVTTLSNARGLAVRPFSTKSVHEPADLDVQKAGHEMRADTLVTGRFRKEADQLQIALEAIDVASNALLWRGNIEAPVQSMIGTHIQMDLRVRGGLVPALGAIVADAALQPRNEQAYELYLKSSALPLDPAPNPEGIAMLERAVELDPTYAPAWLSLGRRYYVEAHFSTGDPAMLTRALTAMEHAAALNPNDVTAAASAVATRVERGELVEAHERARALLRRRPDNVVAQFLMSYVLRYAGLLEESATSCEKAFLIDPVPVNTTLRSCALVFYVRGDYARALNYVNLDRESEIGKAYIVEMLVRQGRNDAALEIGPPRVPQWAAKFDMLFACLQGRPAPEISTLARSVRPVADPEENYMSAAHLSYCGQTDAAVDMLKRAINGNYCSYPAMESDPLFANLRATPKYAEIRAAGVVCQNSFLTQRDVRRP